MRKAWYNQEIVAHRYLNGYPKLDLLYVGDLCKAVLAAIQHRVHGAINVGTGVGVSTTEVAQLLVELVNSRSEIRHIGIEAYASNIVMDIHKARSLLGWSPTIDLRQGLSTLVKIKQHQEVSKKY